MSKPVAAYLVVLILVTLACVLKPQYGEWDMVAYMALVRHDHNPAAVYAELQRSLPSKDYREIIGVGDLPESFPKDPDSVYRRDVATNPEHFFQQMPFYAVKPLYIGTVWLFWKLGIPLFSAAHDVSAIAFFMTGLIVWHWLARHLAGWTCFIIASTLIFQPYLMLPARTPYPDALGIFLLVGGAYFIWERKRMAIGAGMLLLSILARPDALIFCVLLFVSLRMFVPMAAAIAIYLANNYLAHGYGRTILFYHKFVHLLLAPKDAVIHVSLRLYFSVLVVYTLRLLFNDTLLLLVLALGVWVMTTYREQRKYIFLCMATIVLHQLAFPIGYQVDSIRFYAPEYLLILLIAASTFLGRASTGQGGQEGST